MELAQERYTAARASLEQAIALLSSAGYQFELPASLEALAQVAAAQQPPHWAAHLWGLAEALRETMGAPLPPIERRRYAQAVAATRDAPLFQRASVLFMLGMGGAVGLVIGLINPFQKRLEWWANYLPREHFARLGMSLILTGSVIIGIATHGTVGVDASRWYSLEVQAGMMRVLLKQLIRRAGLVLDISG